MKWKDGLKKWREDRNITLPLEEFESAIESEIDEFTLAKMEGSEHQRVDAIADMMVLCANQLALDGYDADLVLKQTVKEISSRKQDPEQASRDWTGEKWQKDPNQPDEDLYTADYTICKLGK